MSKCKENAAFVTKYLDDIDLHYKMHDNGNVATFTYEIGDIKFNTLKAVISVGDDEIENLVRLPVSDPWIMDKLPQMAECLSLINNRIKCGEFQFDYANGGIFFRLVFPMAAIWADKDLMASVLRIPLEMISRHDFEIDLMLMSLHDPILGLMILKDPIENCKG